MIQQFFAKDYNGEPFELFGTAHLFALGIVLLVNLSLLWVRRNPSPRLKTGIRYCLASILVLNEIAWHVWDWVTGQWTIQTMLPLHLCSVLVWMSAIMLVTRSYTIYEFAYFLGIGGAIQALLTPDAGIYGFPHFRFFQIIISHGAIVTSAIYMTIVENYRPYWRSLLKIALWGNLYLAVVALINWFLGSNYLFIAHKPETASMIDNLGPWPWYILSLEVIAIILCLLLYLPYTLLDRRVTASSS
jgi:hypothetical integral membrane protein (TIGR02206 family)